MWYIILIIIAICTLWAVYETIIENKTMSGAKKKLGLLEKEKNITHSFITTVGFLAFCDDEHMLFSYCDSNKEYDKVAYDNIVKYEVKEHEVKGNIHYYWAFSPKHKSFIIGKVNSADKIKMQSVFNEIIELNQIRAFKEYICAFDIPSTFVKATINGYSGNIDSLLTPNSITALNKVTLWESNDFLCLVPQFENVEYYELHKTFYKKTQIAKKNILNLVQEGNIHYETKIEGGGGGGSSIKGAIVGQLLGGNVGAIILSRKSVKPLTSTTSEVDTRATCLKLLDENNDLCEILFEYNDYYTINSILQS